MKFIEFLQGKKTYIAAVLGAFYGVLIAFNVISLTPEQEASVEILFIALLGTTLRIGVKTGK